MTQQQNFDLAQDILTGLGSDREPVEIASLFAPDLVYQVSGDVGALPWIGHKTGRQAIVELVAGLRALTEPIMFDVEDILASEDRAVIVGALKTRIKATNRIAATHFAMILTITEAQVTRFQMLEDSFAVSKAARQ